ncbi:DUF4429 domain-containing protein [Streptomyces reniochalinae]|uniref:DUF4429 domain-containing protein n=1 Tax=Streptomyces reniochalinae TaxID=2250578 RepID=A0A367E907_9ACTN|nr:DUF4429 domain-containing protein [Streptomyces reniochalinae]RCG14534.1 DUF4429 domain-containing protein [Streptomyces reniochalinae]
MAEILQRAGAWTFDGEHLRIVPGTERQVHQLRKVLGEIVVPLGAVAGIAYEPGGRKGGRLRLRLREGADPLSQVARGRLPDSSDPYQLPVEKDRTGVAEYLVEEVRTALLLAEVPGTACDRFLLPGPAVPLTATGSDGTVTFDGENLQLDWNWMAEESKTSAGPRRLGLGDLEGVEWTPALGWENGSLRFRLKEDQRALKPEHDPNCLVLWGVRQARETSGAVRLAAAVAARLPHPHGGSLPAQARDGRALPEADAADPPPKATAGGGPRAGTAPSGGGGSAAAGADHDVLLRRLRELGELHRSGVLTDEEFALAKKAVLDRL